MLQCARLAEQLVYEGSARYANEMLSSRPLQRKKARQYDSGGTALTVLAWPSRINAADNTYTSRLSDSLEAAGVVVVEFSIFRALLSSYDVLHVHWPEGVLKKGRGRLSGMARVIAVVGVLLVVKFVRRRRVVWTVHNLRPHDLDRNAALAVLRVGLGLTVGGYVHLSGASRSLLPTLVARSSKYPQITIPHGRYSGEFIPSESRQSTRARFSIRDSDQLVVFAGQVAPYKGVLDLARVVHESTSDGLRLIIAGRCTDLDYAQEIKRIEAADSRIEFTDERLDAIGLANVMQAADLVAFPYRSILNSGSVLPPLETNTRVLAPSIGAIPEMSATVGEDWLMTYEQPLTLEKLEQGLAHRCSRWPARLDALEWPQIGNKTKAFYLTVLNYRGNRTIE